MIDLVVFFWFTKPMVSWLARFPFFNRGHKLSGLDAETLGIDRSTSAPATALEGGPDGQVLAARQRPLQRQTLDRLRRSQVALVRHLRRSSCCSRSPGSTSRASTSASSSRAARSTRVTLPTEPGRPRTTPTSSARRSPAPASTAPPRPWSPPRAPDSILVQTEPLTTAESAEVVDDDRRRRSGATPDDISQDEIGASWGKEVAKRVAHRPGRLPRAGGAVHLGLLPRVEDVGRGDRRAGPRPRSSRSASTRCPASRSRPATVTGLLTILGFSLYDTVVVFDKVRENTKNLARSRTDLRRGGQPRGQPDPGPLDQHLDRGADPGRRDPLRRRRSSWARAR